MVWLSIVLTILEALPQLITVIKEIVAAIRGQAGNEHAFQAVLLAHAALSNPVKAEADIRAFHAKVTGSAS